MISNIRQKSEKRKCSSVIQCVMTGSPFETFQPLYLPESGFHIYNIQKFWASMIHDPSFPQYHHTTRSSEALDSDTNSNCPKAGLAGEATSRLTPSGGSSSPSSSAKASPSESKTFLTNFPVSELNLRKRSDDVPTTG